MARAQFASEHLPLPPIRPFRTAAAELAPRPGRRVAASFFKIEGAWRDAGLRRGFGHDGAHPGPQSRKLRLCTQAAACQPQCGGKDAIIGPPVLGCVAVRPGALNMVNKPLTMIKETLPNGFFCYANSVGSVGGSGWAPRHVWGPAGVGDPEGISELTRSWHGRICRPWPGVA
jgi:hypothetical protein